MVRYLVQAMRYLGYNLASMPVAKPLGMPFFQLDSSLIKGH
jgi:hypothetical protein